jgi:outer membrane protein W
VDGGTVNFTFERIASDGRFSLGLNTGLVKIHEEFVREDELLRGDYDTIPISLALKWYYGDPRGRLLGYLGLGLGINFSSLAVEAEDGTRNLDSDVGAAFALPVGLQFWFGDEVLLNANWVLTWLGNSFFENNFTNAVQLGLGYAY